MFDAHVGPSDTTMVVGRLCFTIKVCPLHSATIESEQQLGSILRFLVEKCSLESLARVSSFNQLGTTHSVILDNSQILVPNLNVQTSASEKLRKVDGASTLPPADKCRIFFAMAGLPDIARLSAAFVAYLEQTSADEDVGGYNGMCLKALPCYCAGLRRTLIKLD